VGSCTQKYAVVNIYSIQKGDCITGAVATHISYRKNDLEIHSCYVTYSVTKPNKICMFYFTLLLTGSALSKFL